ncbi:MAG TPA: prolyl oligopeptidase family serine peptidase [Nonomuraea sp.]|nr:prolyl oligopeptidase family serine peptidase [Nonomuraea sp.]
MIGRPENGPASRPTGANAPVRCVGEGGLPRQLARTRRFSLGVPSAFTVSGDGATVLFLRSRAGDDPAAGLWALDVDTGEERLLAGPAAGISAYATDDAGTLASFAAAGRLWVVDVAGGEPRELPATGAVTDPRPDPAGRRVAYVAGGGTLRVIAADGADDHAIAEPDGPEVRFGVPEYAAWMSMGRTRGHWWSPDGTRLLVARVDESPVARWYVTDPADPARPPRTVRYPAAGTANADVTLWITALDGARTEVRWDRRAFEYVTAAGWDTHGPYAAVQTRDQRTVRTLAIDPVSGDTTVVAEQRDPRWVHLVDGTPSRTAAGALIAHTDLDGTRHLTLDATPVTPPGLQVREVLAVDGDTILFTASTDPTETHLWLYEADGGPERDGGSRRLSVDPGVHSGMWRAGTFVHVARTLDRPDTTATVTRRSPTRATPATDTTPATPATQATAATRATAPTSTGVAAATDGPRGAAGTGVTVASFAERPVLGLRVVPLATTDRELRSHLLLPSWHRPGGPSLPVLVDPYGGASMQRVTAEQQPMTLVSQWFAEQGYAVLVTDGSGTPGRGPDWEREVHGDLWGRPLADQVAALRAAAARHPELDLDRVAIRGWSFSGTLAVMAVLRHPDVFHAAVAGAGTSDQRLYDTHWRERFLGHPDHHPERYEACSPLSEAHRLSRPLLLIHGLADDNVFPAGTLRLSSALLAAGRAHEVLPLTGVAHSPTADPDVFEGLLLHQLGFLRRHV